MTETTENKSKITLGLITSWGLGGLFLIAGIGGLFQPGATGMGIACLLIAFLLLPPVRRFAHNLTGLSISTGVRIAGFFVLLLGGAATTQQGELATTGDILEAAETSAPALTAAAKSETKGLIVQEFALQMDQFGTGKITGSLKNTTGRKYSYVQIEFSLFNAAGDQVGSTLANINNLDADRVWRFEAPVLAPDAATAQVVNITSF